MDNTLVNAFIPLLAAILTEAIQVVAEAVKGRRWQEVKWERTAVITMAVALVASAIVFLLISNATHCAIDNSGWMPYQNDKLGSTITLGPQVESKCAFQVSFDLKKETAYVAAYKKLEPKFLAPWVRGIEFTYTGMGSPNTMEIKLFSKEDKQYKLVRQHTTNTDGKPVSVVIPYEKLTSVPGGSLFKRKGFVLDRIDFSFSSWVGDTPGIGNVIFSSVGIVLKWYVWLIVFSPILIVGIAMLYSWQKRRPVEAKPIAAPVA